MLQGLYGGVCQASEIVVADFAPEWDYTAGGSKLLISGDFEASSEPLVVLVDGVKVRIVGCAFCMQTMIASIFG